MKWYGTIGFREEMQGERGIILPTVIPKQFFGDVMRNSWRETLGDKINPDLHVSNKLSVVADQYLYNNFHKIAYVTFGGAKWTVSDVEQDPDRPRLNLTLGPLYLEEEEDSEDET